jgi:hypothetical protein
VRDRGYDLVPSVPLELRVLFRDSRFRWRLAANAEVEVWRGIILVGTLSGLTLCHLVEHYLGTAELHVALIGELRDEPAIRLPRKPLQRAPPRPPLPDATERAERRRRRRSRARQGSSSAGSSS